MKFQYPLQFSVVGRDKVSDPFSRFKGDEVQQRRVIDFGSQHISRRLFSPLRLLLKFE